MLTDYRLFANGSNDNMTNEQIVLAIRSGEDVSLNLELLYKQNFALINKIAKRFQAIEDINDLQQEAFFGLVKAVELWDPEKYASFITYAYFWIQQSICQYVYDCSGLIRISSYQRSMIGRYNRAQNLIRMQFGRDPSALELCALLGISNEQLRNIEKDIQAAKVISASKAISENGDDTIEDYLRDPTDQFEDLIEKINSEELAQELWTQVNQLPEKEAAIVRERFQHNKTFKQCGESLDIPPEQVKQIYGKALRKLKKPKVTSRLKPYLSDSTAYSIGTHSSLSSFRYHHTTAQERAVILLEEKTGSIWK